MSSNYDHYDVIRKMYNELSKLKPTAQEVNKLTSFSENKVPNYKYISELFAKQKKKRPRVDKSISAEQYTAIQEIKKYRNLASLKNETKQEEGNAATTERQVSVDDFEIKMEERSHETPIMRNKLFTNTSTSDRENTNQIIKREPVTYQELQSLRTQIARLKLENRKLQFLQANPWDDMNTIQEKAKAVDMHEIRKIVAMNVRQLIDDYHNRRNGIVALLNGGVVNDSSFMEGSSLGLNDVVTTLKRRVREHIQSLIREKYEQAHMEMKSLQEQNKMIKIVEFGIPSGIMKIEN